MTELSYPDRVRGIFSDLFEQNSCRVFFAPGRVNLIGEHIDYNGGHVFPCALTLGTYLAAAPRKDRQVHCYSENFAKDGIISFSLDKLKNEPAHGWANYIKSVLFAYEEKGAVPECGFDIAVTGTLPAKSGLSSSASLEVATATMLNSLCGFRFSGVETALLCQRAENAFIGVKCGIMDQFASAMGKTGHAVFLDTATLEYEYVPIDLHGKKLVIVNTNKPHELADSAYNERRAQCESALHDLQRECNIAALCSLSTEEFEKTSCLIADPAALKRARHAVTEEERTKKAVTALFKGDITAFGKLMNGSHESLKNDFEVSCRELDILAETAASLPGVYGSRMTGGGFGGCTVNIVDEDNTPDFIRILGREYTEKTSLIADFYIASAGDGAHEL